MRISSKKFIFAALSAAFFFLACEKEDFAVGDNFAIISISADGSKVAATTTLTITVNDDKFALKAEDIKINAAFSVIKRVKGDLTEKPGTAKTYELPITSGGSGTIRVGLDPYRGFTGWDAKTAYVYADWYFSGTEELTITGYNPSIIDPLINLIPEKIAGVPVKTIGYRLFYNTGLNEIILSPGIEVIGNSAFANNQLASITIPKGVTTIGSTSFAYNQLTNVIIPESVITIGYGAFVYNQLSEIAVPKNVKYIENSAFAYNRIEKISISEKITSLSGFNDNKLTEVKFIDNDENPGNEKITIGSRAFANNLLESITMPESVIIIGNSAFENNLLKSVTIPENVTDIGDGAFAYNYLEKITIPEKVSSLSGFNNNELTEVKFIDNDKNPSNVTTISSNAFAYNQLKKVDIPKSVKVILNYAFAYNQLERITISEKILSLSGFNNNELIEVKFIDDEKNPSNVTTIGTSAFAYNKLEKIDMPGSVTTIGDYAFANNLLKSVTIPESVKTIGNSAFANNFLESVTIPDNVADIGYRAFANNKLSKIIISDNVESVGIHAFMENPLTSITIGKDVKLGVSAFGNGFESAYNIKYKRAKGTYILKADGWKDEMEIEIVLPPP